MMESRRTRAGRTGGDDRAPGIDSAGFDGSEPLELITAVDVAYHGIRSSILSGEFEPGMQLKLEKLQREMLTIFLTDRIRYLALHQKLHFGMYSRCGSKWTMRLLGLVWSHSDRWRKMALPHDVNAETEDHGPILSALKARDLRAASKALERHIELSVKALQQTLPADRKATNDAR